MIIKINLHVEVPALHFFIANSKAILKMKFNGNSIDIMGNRCSLRAPMKWSWVKPSKSSWGFQVKKKIFLIFPCFFVLGTFLNLLIQNHDLSICWKYLLVLLNKNQNVLLFSLKCFILLTFCLILQVLHIIMIFYFANDFRLVQIFSSFLQLQFEYDFSSYKFLFCKEKFRNLSP